MNTEKTGQLIAELRREKNLTQAELAELILVSDKAISRWETGRGFPDINNLEALSEALDITVAELIKGERIETTISKEELQLVSYEGINLTKELIARKRIENFLIGFLVSLAVLTIAVVHLVSPMYINDPNKALSIDTLSDGRIVAVLNEDVAGYEVGTIREVEGESSLTFISCYKTRLNQLLGKKRSDVVLIGEEGDIERVYYYPYPDGDKLIYGNENLNQNFGGVVTLPRLVYNAWMVIGFGISVVGVIIYLILRKKYYAGKILKALALPIAFTISILLCLLGRFDEVYNAGFYFTGILLLTFVLTLLAWVLLSRRRASGGGMPPQLAKE